MTARIVIIEYKYGCKITVYYINNEFQKTTLGILRVILLKESRFAGCKGGLIVFRITVFCSKAPICSYKSCSSKFLSICGF